MRKSSIRKYNTNENFAKIDLCIDLEKPEDFRPLKIFISYGHTEAVICNLICECLTKRGHIVWYDANDILPGNDWRASIVDGIVGCDTFVAALSKHYTRDNSVCLDELSIAIGVKKGNVKTILLEDENELCIPGSVRNVQWLDLHDWNERILDEKTFGVWFQERMKELIQTLEAKFDRDFNGQITMLRKYLQPNYSMSKQAYLLGKSYTKRAWLNQEINNWLEDKNTRKLCAIFGNPGSGKSIFAANYMHYNARVAAAIFCEEGRPQFNSTNNIIRVLAYQLACRLPEYRIMLSYLINNNMVYKMNESELFDYLITDPLTKSFIGGHDPMCILFDGLDECGDSESNLLAEVLTQYAERLPYWLKILVFSRPESSVVASISNSYCINMEKYNKEIQSDLTNFVSQKLKKYFKREVNNNIIEQIVEKSQGVFLYADFVTQGLIEGQILETDLEQIPPGLNSVFYHWFTRVFGVDSEYVDEYADVLDAIVASKEPLPKEEMRRFWGWSNKKTAEFMRKLNSFLKESINIFGKETVEFSHIYIKEWLCSKNAGRFQCSPEDGIYKMAQYYLKIYTTSGCDGLTEYGALNIRECLRSSKFSLINIEKDSDLFWKIMNLGFSCDDNMKGAEALICYQKANELLGNKIDVEYRSNKISALHMCGNSYRKMGDFKEAQNSYSQELEMAQAAYLDNAITILDMLEVYTEYASFLNFVGKYTDSADIYENAIKSVNQIKEETYDNKLYRKMYRIYSDAAINYRDLKLLERSIEYFNKGINCLERVDELNDLDKKNILTQQINICLVEEDLNKWEGHLVLYYSYLEMGRKSKCLITQAYANTYIGCEYQRLGNLEDAKTHFEASYRCYSRLVTDSDDIKWRADKFISLTRLAQVEYKLTRNTELYERAIIMGEALVDKWFLESSVIALLFTYADYVFENNNTDRIPATIKNIILIAKKVENKESYRIKNTLAYIFWKILECIDSTCIEKKSRILLYKYAMQCIDQIVYKEDKLPLIECIIYSFSSELKGEDNLLSVELDNEVLSGLKNLNIQLRKLIEYYKQFCNSCDIGLVVLALMNLGHICEKCKEYHEAYEAYYKAAILEQSYMQLDLFAYRRVYFALNDCGRMKVKMGLLKEATEFFEHAVEYINDMFEHGILGDEDDKSNLIMIEDTIKYLKSNE